MQDARLLFSGSGSPEGKVTAVAGACYLDPLAQVFYDKSKGSGTTGWEIAIPAPILQGATVTLSAAQMLNLKATPVVLVAAPGAGKAIQAIEVVCQYKFVTTPYTISPGGNISFPYAGSAGTLSAFSSAGLIDQVVGRIQGEGGAITDLFDTSAADNKALVITQTGSGEWSAGDGTLTVTVYYTVVTLA